MLKYMFTVGLFDKDTCKQEIQTDNARRVLDYILLEEYGIYAFTMINCEGRYRMESTGEIIREPSIRLEIVSDEQIDYLAICETIKTHLNQESVMIEISQVDVQFL